MESSHREIAQQWFEEIWNQGRGELIEQLLTPNSVAHGLLDGDGNELRGADEFRAFFQAFKSAFPDIHVDVLDTISEGDRVAVRCMVHGTHTGDGIGLSPTRQQVSITGITIMRFEQGRVAESWNNYDFQMLYRQIGVSDDEELLIGDDEEN